jgi:hypothetical protein
MGFGNIPGSFRNFGKPVERRGGCRFVAILQEAIIEAAVPTNETQGRKGLPSGVRVVARDMDPDKVFGGADDPFAGQDIDHVRELSAALIVGRLVEPTALNAIPFQHPMKTARAGSAGNYLRRKGEASAGSQVPAGVSLDTLRACGRLRTPPSARKRRGILDRPRRRAKAPPPPRREELIMPATAPISLSDEELSFVMRITAPLPAHCRGAYLQALAKLLQQEPPSGPGVTYRLARELLREFWKAPQLTNSPSLPHHSRRKVGSAIA